MSIILTRGRALTNKGKGLGRWVYEYARVDLWREMGKPLCEVCGDRHEKHQAHRFVANANPVANTVANVEKVANKSVEWLRVKLWRQANKDKYNARQRELMKRKRAKEKQDGKAD